jgi:hypothetical protein
MSAEAMAPTYTRPPAPRAGLVATIVAAIFALGLIAGVVISPALHAIGQPVSAGAATVTGAAAAEAHLAWLQSEHDSYPSTTGSATAAEAHLAWLQSEHDSYPVSIAPISDQQSWLVYRQFRLEEEGYGN